MMKYNELDSLIREISQIDVIEIEQIPNIDLYMDQVTTFMEEHLKGFKRFEEDKILTKTMINNYAKARLFPPPVKKKYTRCHMMLLVLIYHLKNFLSINDIDKLLKPITEELKATNNPKTLLFVYETFLMIQKENANSAFTQNEKAMEFIEEKIGEIDDARKKELKNILIVLSLCIQANQKKRLAEKMLDKFF